MHPSKTAVVTLLLVLLTACGGGGSDGGGGSQASVTVSASAGTGGSITPATATVIQGNTTGFTVTPDSGFDLDSVSGCGGSLSGSTYTTGAITAACTVAASFKATDVSTPTYSVGGSVTGMTGSGLVIANNTTDQLTLNAVGDFVFTEELEAGQTFDVQVVTRPANPANICSIENASGTIGSADVSNIEILCTGPLVLTDIQPADADENVSRAIRPLLSFSTDIDPATALPENIMLTSAAGDVGMTFNVAANEVTLTPDSILLPLTDYTLNVTTDILGSGGERLLDPLRITFKTRDAIWHGDIEIDASNGTANDAQIVFDADGNALAVWNQQSATGAEIWWNFFTAGVGWDLAKVLEPNATGQSAGSPRVGFDPSGNAIAVWTVSDSASGTISVRSSYLDVAGNTGWTASEFIDTQPDEVLGTVELAVNDSGDAVATWIQFDGTFLNVWANRYTVGGGWEVATVIDETDDIVEKPRVAINNRGEVLVVWSMRRSPTLFVTDVWARRYDPGSDWNVWQDSVLLSTSSQRSAAAPRPALASDGIAQVIWIEERTITEAVIASRYTAAGGWTAPDEISVSDAITDPEIAIDRTGNAIAVWRQSQDVNGTRELLPYAARHTEGTGWDNTPGAIGNRDAFYPKIAFDASGHALAVWFELDLALPLASAYSVWGNRYTNGSGWTSAEQIGSNGGRIGGFMPNLAIDPSGDAFAVWTRAAEVRVNRFE